MKTITHVAALTVLTALAVISPASIVMAGPFIIGTANAAGHEIFQFDLATNTATTLLALPNGEEPDSVVFDNTGHIIYTMHTASQIGEVHRYDPITQVDQTLVTNLYDPKDLVLEPGGTSVLVSEAGGGGHLITRVTLCAVPPCTATSLPGTYASSDGPQGLAYIGPDLFANIGDRTGGFAGSGLPGDSQIAQIDPITGAVINTGAFDNESGYLNSLDGLTYDSTRGRLYATSVLGNFVYEFDPNNLTLAPTILFNGPGLLLGPDGLAADDAGSLFIASFGSGQLMQCSFASNSCAQVGATIAGVDDLALQLPSNVVDAAAVPEPGSLLLLGSVLLGLTRYRSATPKRSAQ